MSEVSSTVPTQGHKYHVYVSYASVDRSWAQELFRALERRGIEVFLDQRRLEPGAQWPGTPPTDLRLSQHLLVLWSENARESDWVQRELGYFESISAMPSPEETPNRRVIIVTLDRTPTVYQSDQIITDLRDAGAYAGSADEVDSVVWQRVVDKVQDAIVPDSTSSRV